MRRRAPGLMRGFYCEWERKKGGMAWEKVGVGRGSRLVGKGLVGGVSFASVWERTSS